MGSPFFSGEREQQEETSTSAATTSSSSVGGGGSGGVSGGVDLEGVGGRALGGSDGAGGAGGAPSGSSTVLVVDQDHHPVANADLVVNDALGAVVAAVKSGADGTAALVVPEGGSVSALWAQPYFTSVVSFVAPPPGASITLGVEVFPLAPPPPDLPTEFHVVVGSPNGVTTFACSSTCGEGSGTKAGQSCTLNNLGCSSAATEDILVVAYQDQKAVAWGAVLGIPTNPGGKVNVNVSTTQIILPTPVEISGIPDGATGAGVVAKAFASPRVGFAATANAIPPASSLFSGALAVPAGLAGGYELTDSVVTLLPGMTAVVQRVRRYASLPAQTNFDASTMARVSISPLDLSDLLHPVLSWTASEGLEGDAGRVTLAWHTETTTSHYVVYLPPGHERTFRVPDVPPALEAFMPAAESAMYTFATAYVDFEGVADYATLLTAVYGGAGMQDGLGTVTSSALASTP
ncbi:MAG: hypothetical protein ABI193_02815 [Minicystis sp.]